MASKVKGVAQLRKRLRQMPDFVRSDIAEELRASGQRMLARAKAEAPKRTGGLSGALSFKVAPKTLNMRIGLVTKAMRRKFFYGYILDQGRKAKTVQVKRRTKSGVTSYAMRVKAIPRNRYDFVFGRMRDFRTNELPHIRRALEKALSRVSRGVE